MGNPASADLIIDALAGKAVQLATNEAVAANGRTSSKGPTPRGVYLFDAAWTGTADVTLQALGADGVSWRNVATLSAPGTFAGEIRIGAGAVLALRSSAAITGLSAVLS